MATQVRAKHKSAVKKVKAHTLMERRVFEEITKPIYPSAYIDNDSCLGKRLARVQEEVCWQYLSPFKIVRFFKITNFHGGQIFVLLGLVPQR